MDYFTFDGIDSRNLGVYIHDGNNPYKSKIISSNKTTTTGDIVGKNGSILFDQKYTSKNIPLNLFVEDKTLNEDFFNDLARELCQLGEGDLILSYEGYKSFRGYFDGQVEIEYYQNQGVMFNLNFIAVNPFGFTTFTSSQLNEVSTFDSDIYYDSGATYDVSGSYSLSNIVSGNTIDIHHGGNCDLALPIFKFDGSATDILVRQFKDSARTIETNRFSYGAFSGTLDVNWQETNVYKNGNLDNNTFEWDEFTKLKGKNKLNILNQDWLQNKVSNTQITLSQGASAVDDIYNGKILNIISKVNLKPYSVTILDYNGTTKVATIDSEIIEDLDLYNKYFIVEKDDGMNYFTITGNGFSNLNLLVDFRFVYL